VFTNGAAFDPLLQMELSHWMPDQNEVTEITKAFYRVERKEGEPVEALLLLALRRSVS